MESYFERRYRDGCIPWDHGMADSNLARIVERFGIAPCKALDIGCGTGDNVAWLAEQGFSAMGCDLSETAIQMAQSKPVAGAGRFMAADFLTHPFPRSSFGFVLDRGCFHSVEGTSARRGFAAKVANVLEEGGLWLSLVGNADELRRENGPPRMSATQIVTLVEPFFEILLLESGFFGSDQDAPPRAWICLMQKRGEA